MSEDRKTLIHPTQPIVTFPNGDMYNSKYDTYFRLDGQAVEHCDCCLCVQDREDEDDLDELATPNGSIQVSTQPAVVRTKSGINPEGIKRAQAARGK